MTTIPPGDMDGQPLWIFAYGSLMWNPGFPHSGRSRARISGYERRFCLWSRRYRGTDTAPGLVLGLAERPGRTCTGIAYRVEPPEVAGTRRYLWEREMGSGAYLELLLPARLLGDRDSRKEAEVNALAYVMDSSRPHYADIPDESECARIIAGSSGLRGKNSEYLEHTLRKLSELQVREPGLERIAAQVRAMRRGQPPDSRRMSDEAWSATVGCPPSGGGQADAECRRDGGGAAAKGTAGRQRRSGGHAGKAGFPDG